LIALTTQKLALAAAVATALGTAVYEEHRLSQLRQQVQALQQQQEPLTTQINDLIAERDRLAEHLQAAQDQHRIDVTHLPRLRAEVSRLRNEAQELAQLKALAAAAQPQTTPTLSEAETLAAKVAWLRQKLEQMPNQKLPELQFADEQDWLEAAKRVQTDSDLDVRKGLSLLRTLAKNKVAPVLMGALQDYTAANNGELPASMAQLKPFLKAPLDDAIFDRYEPILASNVNTAGFNTNAPVLREKSDATIDKTYDPTPARRNSWITRPRT
jgi:chromosome segregation ATPase